MGTEWSEGYFTQTNYTYGYYRELSPLFQRFCLLLKGLYVDPFNAKSNHCELGFGQGLSFAIHAATNPGAFYGTDFNPSQVLNAHWLTTACDFEATVFDDSFSDFLGRETPNFDSIGLHGIWSWVNKDNQKVLVEIAKRKLVPGGQLYISYNSLPGWAAGSPLRHLFSLHSNLGSTTTDAHRSIVEAIEFADQLLNANPNYLTEAPSLKHRLEGIRKSDTTYLGHEYFNSNWNCMYFSEVAQDLSLAKLEFAASAEPGDSIDTLNLRAEGIEFLRKISDPVLKEQSRDYFLSRQFRKDIYVKGMRRLSKAEQIDLIQSTPFMLLVHPSSVPNKLRMPAGEFELKKEIYTPIMNALAENSFKPCTIGELIRKVPKVNLAQCIDAIILLTHFRFVSPCHMEETVEEVLAAARSLNEKIINASRFSADIGFLASPVIGGGVPVNRIEQLFLMRLNEGAAKKDLPKDVLEILWNQDQRIIKDGITLESYEENLKALDGDAKKFISDKFEILKTLKVH